MRGWANSDDFRISIGSPASSPWLECGGSSVTLGPWSSRSAGAEKNSLRGLRDRASRLLRSTAAPRARSLLRRPTSLSRALGSPGRLLSVRWREARAARLAGRQSPLHQAVRLLRGPTLPREHRQGDRRGTAPGLAHRQGAGQAVHARATPPGRLPRAAGHRHRRDRHRQGPQLPHRGQRPGSGAADLVRRQGPLRGEPGRVLRLARPREMPQDPPGRHGHVEGVPQLHPQGGPCPAGPDHLRQVPRPQAPGGGHGQGAQAGIRPALGRTSAASSRGRGTTCCLAGRT